MATATYSSGSIGGGSNSDRVTFENIDGALSVPIESITTGLAAYKQTNTTQLKLANGGFFDLTNVEFYPNAKFHLNGDIVVGRDDNDYCRLHFKNSDGAKIGLSSTAKLVCEVPIELYERKDLVGAEPGASSQITLENNNPASEIRLHYYGTAFTRDSNWTLPNAAESKPNGSAIIKWTVGSDVLVRELVFKDGFVDWRPLGDWAAPTSGGFFSKTSMKWLGKAPSYSNTTPLVFGSKDDKFSMEIGLAGGAAYFLCGWNGFTSQMRNVFNNLSGLDIQGQTAFFKNVQLENHVQFTDKFIDASGTPLSGVETIVYHKPPAIEQNTTLVLQAEKELRQIATGASIEYGNGDGDVTNNICIEAMRKWGGNADVDNNYSSINATGTSYISAPTIETTYKKWGKVVQERVTRTFILSGNEGDGKPEDLTIKLNDDFALTALDIDSVSDDNLYDLCYKWAYQNDIPNIASKDGDFIDLGAYDIEFKDIANKGSNDVFDVTGNQITYYVTPQLDANIRTTGLATGKEFVNGSITDVEGTTTLVNFNSGFSDSSVLVYDKAANETISYQTDKSAPYSLLLGAEHNGKELTYVVSRAGYTTVIGEFTAGGVVNISTSQSLRKTSSGQALYQSLTNSNISIVFDLTAGAEICFIDIGNASVKAQEVVDVLEVALESEDGGKFLAITNGSSCTVETLAGQTYILLGTQYRFRRKTAADVNSAVQAFGISADGIPQDGVNGAVQFLTASTLTEESIAQAVWNYMQSEPTVSDSMREQLDKLTSQVEVNAG